MEAALPYLKRFAPMALPYLKKFFTMGKSKWAKRKADKLAQAERETGKTSSHEPMRNAETNNYQQVGRSAESGNYANNMAENGASRYQQTGQNVNNMAENRSYAPAHSQAGGEMNYQNVGAGLRA